MPVVDGSIMEIENAAILYADFSGREGPYQKAGSRYFGVKIVDDSQEHEDELKAAGWRVRRFEFENRPNWGLVLHVYLATLPAFPSLSISEESMKSIPETAQASCVEQLMGETLVIYGQQWEYHGKEGLKAYLGNIR